MEFSTQHFLKAVDRKKKNQKTVSFKILKTFL